VLRLAGRWSRSAGRGVGVATARDL
jgi:hypothetical protein